MLPAQHIYPSFFESDARRDYLNRIQEEYWEAISKATVVGQVKKDFLQAEFVEDRDKAKLDAGLLAVDKAEDKAFLAAARVLRVKERKEIIIPAWNDVIKLGAERTFTAREIDYMRDIRTHVDVWGRSVVEAAKFFELSVPETAEILDLSREEEKRAKKAQQRVLDMMKSPTPAFAANIGVVMNALDDIQDFATTVGVVSRILGRAVKPLEYVAGVAFTAAETMNRFNLLNRMTGGEISRLCRMLREARNSSHKRTIASDVDKRMKRLLPSKGELLEIAQTTNSFFGVGVSFGALVGLVTDMISGLYVGAPYRFRGWEMSGQERKVISGVVEALTFSVYDLIAGVGLTEPEIDRTGYKVLSTGIPPPKEPRYTVLPGEPPLPPEFSYTLIRGMHLNESSAILIANGQDLEEAEYFRALIANIESNLAVRKAEVVEALKAIWEVIWPFKAGPPKKTRVETRLFMQSLGIDPYGPSGWPIEGLGDFAYPQEIQQAIEIAANKSLEYWRNKLGNTDKGLFLDACVNEIGAHAAVMFCAGDGVVTESLEPYTLIYVNALESHLNPPSDTPNEKFAEWSNYILGQMQYYDMAAPDLKLLQEAHHRFFEV